MCGNYTRLNNTNLVNPNYPQSFAGGSRCSYRIYKAHHDICQLRIDFLIFSLAQPTGDGNCVVDYFTVENGNTIFPKICGENRGHHVYVNYNQNFPATIVIATTAGKTFNRRWQLRVSQIRCLSPFRGEFNLFKMKSKYLFCKISSSRRLSSVSH
jgi:CUB domain